MNIIAYKLPGEAPYKIYEVGSPVPLSFSKVTDGYVVSPFDPTGTSLFYPLEKEISSIPESKVKENYKNFTFYTSTLNHYDSYLKHILEFLDGNPEFKVVASRREDILSSLSPYKMFLKLCEMYPSDYVFFVSTSEFGTWIGASPELLLKKEGDMIMSMSLAGTKSIEGHSEKWDKKNVEEQGIVTRHIESIFKKHGLLPDIKSTVTKKAGKVEHLMTEICAKWRHNLETGELIKELSPTPALAGFPREEAINIIRKFEGDRLLYGGYCGPIFKNGDFIFNVMIRCAYIGQYDSGFYRTTLFAGGGITYLSDYLSEWKETEIKLATIKDCLL